MITLEQFKTNISSFNFFEDEKKLEDYYKYCKAGVYSISSNILRKQLFLLCPNIVSSLSIINDSIMSREAVKRLAWFPKDEMFNIEVDLPGYSYNGIYHLMDIYSVNNLPTEKYNSFYIYYISKILPKTNRKNYVIDLMDSISESPSKYSLNNTFRNIVLINLLKKFPKLITPIQLLFLQRVQTNLRIYLDRHVEVYNKLADPTILSGLSFERVDSKDTYIYLFNLLRQNTNFSNLLDKLYLI